MAAKVTPVVTLRIPFGLDNHEDADLYDEWFQGSYAGGQQTGVALAHCYALASLNQQDATFATMNVFGLLFKWLHKSHQSRRPRPFWQTCSNGDDWQNINPSVTGGVT